MNLGGPLTLKTGVSEYHNLEHDIDWWSKCLRDIFQDLDLRETINDYVYNYFRSEVDRMNVIIENPNGWVFEPEIWLNYTTGGWI